MDLSKILAELHQDRNSMTQAINSLEEIAAGRANDQGLPPAIKKRGRPLGSKNKVQQVRSMQTGNSAA